MKLGLLSGSIALAIASSAACATAVNSDLGIAPDSDGGADGATSSTEESPDDPPHALGVILIGEIHQAGSSTSSPSVSASFVPMNKGETAACGKEIDGCRLIETPKCGDDLEPGCGYEEMCVLDAKCKSVCQPIPKCTPACDEETETCKLVGAKSKCVAKLEFDAGVIVLSGDGMTKAITLRPPYAFTPSGDSPFVPEGKIAISATGAVESGFDKFSDEFTATTFIQTSPALEKLDPAKVFEGTGPLSLGWKPGDDQIRITLSSGAGGATCEADDASGKFDVSRKVLRALFDGETTYGTPGLSVSITRTKTELRKDKKTIGSVEGLPEAAFVRLVTSSTESHTLQGCTSGLKRCPIAPGSTQTSCVDTMGYDSNNCGGCGITCPSGRYCYSGSCS